MNIMVLDSHVHCGCTLPYERVSQEWAEGGISGGAAFSPVEEIYDRYDPSFTDSHEYEASRARVHRYLLDIAARHQVYPYFFVWNDFPQIPDGFVGIKWHRHPEEPIYNYGTVQCDRMIEEICDKKLPVVLEEEFGHTLDFIRSVNGETVVIIPHMGGLNGGYYRLKRAGVFENHMVWADTALAGTAEIEDFAQSYGVSRVLFGSDFPFGNPAQEKNKIVRSFSGDDLEAILSGNFTRLLRDSALRTNSLHKSHESV